MKKELVILIANIGNGKSTLAKQYAKKKYFIISRDSLRYMIGAGDYTFLYQTEPFIKKSALKILDTFMQSGYNLVWDETNVSKNLRVSAIKLAKKNNYKVVAVVLPRLSKKLSVKRRMTNPHGQFDKSLWESVWEKFDSIYEFPKKSEGIDKIVRLK